MNAIPHGCIWLYHPLSRRGKFGPIVKVKIHGRAATYPLSREPFGDALGYCGLEGFLVSGRSFTVTTSSAWFGPPQRVKNECVSDFLRSMIWVGYVTESGQVLRWSSPPLQG